MNYNTLISVSHLSPFLQHPQWRIIDCRFSLADVDIGASAYRYGHIPGACYADLNKDLSAGVTEMTGRHPLPDFSQLARKLATWGVSNQTQVVAYDDAGGVFASRLWWLLRTMGHDRVAVLDGGIGQWQQQGLPLTTHLPGSVKKQAFRLYLNDNAWLTVAQLETALAKKQICLLDARSPERYRGEQEPIDPVAGHIPHALNRNYQLNLDRQGQFLSASQLLSQFRQLIGSTDPRQVVHYCGSGVTACHNLLAMEVAGLIGSKLYAGSWSEWIRNKNRTVVQSK